jgi:hypothetical protein
MLQVYGGLNVDGSLGVEFAAALPRGRKLRVRLAAIDGRPDLYPLQLSVRVNELPIGRVTVASDGVSEATFELPEAVSSAPYEVLLQPRIGPS